LRARATSVYRPKYGADNKRTSCNRETDDVPKLRCRRRDGREDRPGRHRRLCLIANDEALSHVTVDGYLKALGKIFVIED